MSIKIYSYGEITSSLQLKELAIFAYSPNTVSSACHYPRNRTHDAPWTAFSSFDGGPWVCRYVRETYGQLPHAKHFNNMAEDPLPYSLLSWYSFWINILYSFGTLIAHSGLWKMSSTNQGRLSAFVSFPSPYTQSLLVQALVSTLPSLSLSLAQFPEDQPPALQWYVLCPFNVNYLTDFGP